MRIKINEYREMQELGSKFKEWHIEAYPAGTYYLVVDKIR